MPIHHMIIKSAEKMGFTIEERGENVRTFIPGLGVEIFGVSAKDAMNQTIAFLNTHNRDESLRFKATKEKELGIGTGYLYTLDGGKHSKQIGTPVALYRAYCADEIEWIDGKYMEQYDGDEEDDSKTIEETFDEKPVIDPEVRVVKRSEKGVPLNGADAYREGVMAADNPYEEGTPECEQWFDEWDAAADEKEEHPDVKRGGSVVSRKYRDKYAELGHPTHSGDWLAELLNNYCVGKKSTDIVMFDNICAMNGVDTSRYNRTTPGWQGRIRMTGRNLMAKRVFTVGYIMVPDTDNNGEPMKIDAPTDWMAAQRYSKPQVE